MILMSIVVKLSVMKQLIFKKRGFINIIQQMNC